MRAINIEDSSHLAVLVKAWHHDFRSGEIITGDIVLKLLSVLSDERALLGTALTTLAGTHGNLAARENVGVADILANEDLCINIRLLIVEANEAEFVTENFR